MEAITGFVGRSEQITEAVGALRAGNSLVVKGRAGIGKSAFLRQVHLRLSSEMPCFWLADINGKAAMFHLAGQVHDRLSLKVPERFIPDRYRGRAHQSGIVRWEWIKRAISRAPIRETTDLILVSLRDKGAIVFLETLEVPPTQAELYHDLAEVAQLAAAMEENNRRVRIQRLLWRFQKTIELKPLSREQTRELVSRWLDKRTIRFTSDRVRESFLRAVEQDSGGVPVAIEGMLLSATNDGEVTPSSIRAYRHEAGTSYMDMTPALVLAVIGFMAMRYVSRGIGEIELLVMSGVASALFYGLTMMLRRLSR
jgi:hypothetical protein